MKILELMGLACAVLAMLALALPATAGLATRTPTKLAIAPATPSAEQIPPDQPCIKKLDLDPYRQSDLKAMEPFISDPYSCSSDTTPSQRLMSLDQNIYRAQGIRRALCLMKGINTEHNPSDPHSRLFGDELHCKLLDKDVDTYLTSTTSEEARIAQRVEYIKELLKDSRQYFKELYVKMGGRVYQRN